jgi:hypothetical protein
MMTELDVLKARLDKIERRDRWVALSALGVVATLGLALMMGAGGAKRVVEAESFILRDAAGKMRARFEVEDDGAVAQVLFDRNGMERARLAVEANQISRFALRDTDFATRVIASVHPSSGTEKSRAFLAVEGGNSSAGLSLSTSNDLTAEFSLRDQKGERRSVIGVDAENEVAISLSDDKGKARAVRSVAANGTVLDGLYDEAGKLMYSLRLSSISLAQQFFDRQGTNRVVTSISHLSGTTSLGLKDSKGKGRMVFGIDRADSMVQRVQNPQGDVSLSIVAKADGTITKTGFEPTTGAAASALVANKPPAAVQTPTATVSPSTIAAQRALEEKAKEAATKKAEKESKRREIEKRIVVLESQVPEAERKDAETRAAHDAKMADLKRQEKELSSTGRIFAQSQIHDKIMAAYKETVVTWRAETLRREIAGLKTELIELRD